MDDQLNSATKETRVGHTGMKHAAMFALVAIATIIFVVIHQTGGPRPAYAQQCQGQPTLYITQNIPVEINNLEPSSPADLENQIDGEIYHWLNQNYGDDWTYNYNLQGQGTIQIYRGNDLLANIESYTIDKSACTSVFHASIGVILSFEERGELWMYRNDPTTLPGGDGTGSDNDMFTQNQPWMQVPNQVWVKYKVEYCFTDDNNNTFCISSVEWVLEVQ